MHLSWYDFKKIKERKMSFPLLFVSHPHFIWCRKCRKELSLFREECEFLEGLKKAYTEGEMLNSTIMSERISAQS